MKIEEIKFYEKINLEGDWIAYPEDVSVFVKALIPYLKQLERKVEYLENRVEQLDNMSHY